MSQDTLENTARPAGDFFALAGRAVSGLDGLRGLACLMIFNVHYFAQFSQQNYFIEPEGVLYQLLRTLHSGSHGVEVFFVVSGYLIYGSIRRKRPTFAGFLLERYKRLLPVVLVINIPALFWVNASLPEIIDNIFFLQLFPGSRLVTFVSWALVYEMYFYILAGVWLIACGRGRASGPPWWSFAALCALFVANSLYFRVHPVLSDWRFAGFFVGLGLAMLADCPRGRAALRLVPRAVWPVCLALLLLGCWLWSQNVTAWLSARSQALALAYFVAYDLVVAVLIASFLNPDAPGRRGFFEWRGLRVVGAVSYSLFMLHTQWGLPLGTSLFPFAPASLGELAWHYAFSLGVSFVLATFLYVHLERFYFVKRP